MGDQDERTVIISSRELADHAVLSRRRNELAFKKDMLLKAGAKEGELHLKALGDELAAVEEKLSPIGEKLSVADLITIIPNRREITEYTEKINQHSRVELDAAVKNKSGEVYDLMKKRATVVKGNYGRRDDIARLTILLNTFPRKEAESLRGLIEEGQGTEVDVSFLPKEKQQDLLNLTSRLGRECCVYAGSFSLDKKKVESSELKAHPEVVRVVGGHQIWVDSARISEFDENEKVLQQLLAAIQAKGAEKTARNFTDDESAHFDRIQHEYLDALARRATYIKNMELSESAKVYKKGSWKDSVGDGH